jgi:hypothetical protein
MPIKEFRCLVCGQSENHCTCYRYCALCQGDYQLRLCEDGQYYCVDCRRACQYKTQEDLL